MILINLIGNTLYCILCVYYVQSDGRVILDLLGNPGPNDGSTSSPGQGETSSQDTVLREPLRDHYDRGGEDKAGTGS